MLFATHAKPQCYRRLMFEISSAPEKYQGLINKSCNGVQSLNIYDDIIIFGRDEDKHDIKLGNVSKCFQQKQLLVNAKKKKEMRHCTDFKIWDK